MDRTQLLLEKNENILTASRYFAAILLPLYAWSYDTVTRWDERDFNKWIYNHCLITFLFLIPGCVAVFFVMATPLRRSKIIASALNESEKELETRFAQENAAKNAKASRLWLQTKIRNWKNK